MIIKRFSSSVSSSLLPYLLALAAALYVMHTAAFANVATVREMLPRLTVEFSDIALVLTIFGLALVWPQVRALCALLSRKETLLLIGLLTFGLLEVRFLAPSTNRIYFDEHIYQNIAQSIAHTGRATLCNEGYAEYGEYHCVAEEYNKEPSGYPFILSWFFRAFGVSETTTALANNCAFILSAFVLFLLSLALIENKRAAFTTLGVVLSTPLWVRWSNTAAVEPWSVASASVAVLAAVFYARSANASSLAFLIGAVSLAATLRPESILIVPIVILFILFLSPRALFSSLSARGAALQFFMLLPEFLHLHLVRNEAWGSNGVRFSLQIARENIRVNGPFYWLNEEYPLVFTLAALVMLLQRKQWRENVPLLLWFLMLWGIFVPFYAGSYHYGADQRFSLLSAAPLAVLAGWGISALGGWVEQRSQTRMTAPMCVALVLLFSWTTFAPVIRSTTQEAIEARDDVAAIRAFSKKIPPGALVFSHVPAAWLMQGKNSAQTSIAVYNRPHLENDLALTAPGGLFFHWGAWCNYQDEGQKALCPALLGEYRTTVVAEQVARGNRYSLYKLELSKK